MQTEAIGMVSILPIVLDVITYCTIVLDVIPRDQNKRHKLEYNFQCRHPDKRYPRYIHDNSADLSRLFFVQKFYYLLYISEETYLVSLIA